MKNNFFFMPKNFKIFFGSNSYARIINRRVSRAFSFSQDNNKFKKTISSVFRSPFQSSYLQQSLDKQKASKLTSLTSLHFAPNHLETKRRSCIL